MSTTSPDRHTGRPFPPAVAAVQRAATDLHVWIYRLSGGRLLGNVLGPILLLTTVGRKTGKLRTAPLLYAPDGDAMVLIASNGGAPKSPTWALNLRDHPEALVQIGARRLRVRAEFASPEERPRLWKLATAIYPTYDQYQARTTREIPVIVLRPLGD